MHLFADVFVYHPQVASIFAAECEDMHAVGSASTELQKLAWVDIFNSMMCLSTLGYQSSRESGTDGPDSGVAKALHLLLSRCAEAVHVCHVWLSANSSLFGADNLSLSLCSLQW